jgi:hypothetical protein
VKDYGSKKSILRIEFSKQKSGNSASSSAKLPNMLLVSGGECWMGTSDDNIKQLQLKDRSGHTIGSIIIYSRRNNRTTVSNCRISRSRSSR